ncbi:MAG: hypothetical protein KKF48_01670 [Nanoarchaeota archaeon]|nr:hypothetical protein [Nanoarchaeota archaeon]MBU1027729.1 hypothetical protein [Nanoarchaeota archaeon]
MVKNILFVCKHNVFRSKVAETYFKKINKNKNLKASSAGIIKWYSIRPNTKKVCRKLGIKLKGKSKPIDFKILKKTDYVVIVADNVPKSIFNQKYLKKVIMWKIKDVSSKDNKGIEKTVKQIIKKVDPLVRKLEKLK